MGGNNTRAQNPFSLKSFRESSAGQGRPSPLDYARRVKYSGIQSHDASKDNDALRYPTCSNTSQGHGVKTDSFQGNANQAPPTCALAALTKTFTPPSSRRVCLRASTAPRLSWQLSLSVGGASNHHLQAPNGTLHIALSSCGASRCTQTSRTA